MKKRILSLYVENDVGVLAKISGLFSGKCYNLDSLTVGATEDETVSRITITLTGDDEVYEQIKKQLNRCIEVIKVIDFTDFEVVSREHMYLKITAAPGTEVLLEGFPAKVVRTGAEEILIEQTAKEQENTRLIEKLRATGRVLEVIRGGAIAIINAV